MESSSRETGGYTRILPLLAASGGAGDCETLALELALALLQLEFALLNSQLALDHTLPLLALEHTFVLPSLLALTSSSSGRGSGRGYCRSGPAGCSAAIVVCQTVHED